MAIRIDGTNTTANPGITGADADTGLQFGTNEIELITGGTNRATVESNGNFTIEDGNLVVAAGHGIDFSADANASGMSSELLDDYEEGSFTPSLTGVSTYVQQDGFYVKIGSMVYFFIRIDGNAVSTTGNDLVITGLPFSSSAGPPFGGAWRSFGRMVQGSTLNDINFHIPSSATSIRIYNSTTLLDDNSSGVAVSEVFILNGFYNTVL